MDWREGDPERRAAHYTSYREFQAEVERRKEWEDSTEGLLTTIVTHMEKLKKFRWQALALLGFISAVVPIGLTIISFLIKNGAP
jgi:hypothetical protein